VRGAVTRILLTVARGLAAFLGAYTALSLFALARGGSHNQNAWWIDLSMLPTPLGLILQLVLVVVLVAFVVRVPRRRLTRLPAAALCALFCLFALLNCGAVYEAQALGLVRLGFPFPFSGFIALVFLWLALALLLGNRPESGAQASIGASLGQRRTSDTPFAHGEGVEGFRPSDAPARPGLARPGLARPPGQPHPSGTRTRTRTRVRSRLATAFGIAVTVAAAGVLFPLGQILCFGTTDYRQPVDAVVVLGAQVLPDGTPSLALKDRLDTAIDLYDQGLTPVLIMSGGIDAGGVSEAVAMRDYAVARGVPEQAIQVDEYGNSTQATARNTIEMARRQGLERLGVTSSFYHMARIKMLYLVNGIDVLTMPAPLDERDTSIPLTTLREIPGWWYYWFASVLM
jgi:vancomycin permeability regulator SanA